MGLIPFWYIIIAILWTGFFVLEGFDFGKCRHWTLTDDLSDFSKGQKLRAAYGNSWTVFEASDLAAGASVYGACHTIPDGAPPKRIECLDVPELLTFPISGVTYEGVKHHKGDPRSLASYRCVQGCKKTGIQTLHDMGYESEENNVLYDRELARFEKVCPGVK